MIPADGGFSRGTSNGDGFSVLRHRLLGIQITVNRLAVGAVLTLLLFGVYATVAVVVAGVAGGTGLQWPPVLAAGVTVAALGPVYRFARSAVDRVMFGDRERPDRVLRRLASGLGETLDPLDVARTVVHTVRETLRLPFVALDRVTPNGRLRVAAVGLAPDDARITTFCINFSGDLLAEMQVASRVGQDALTTSDRALLADLAAQAGPALYAGKLVDELADSRERLRQGRLDERAALRRALHDGISPTLAGIAIAAAAARDRPLGDPAVNTLLTRIEQEAGAGSATLKALLAGLHPPGLAELGLAAAIEQRASELAGAAGIRFDVSNEEPFPALAPEVEQTAYLVTVEAMVNVARHAGARSCAVRVAGRGHVLQVEVIDDGAGLDPRYRDGEGLRSARERLTACGGSLALENGARGTRLTAEMPVWSRS